MRPQKRFINIMVNFLIQLERFRNFWSGLSVAENSRRLFEATTSEVTNKFHDLVMGDRKLQIRDIVIAVDIRSVRVQDISTKILNMKIITGK